MPIFKTSKARENILRRIRTSLGADALPIPYPDAEKETQSLFAHTDQPQEEIFASEFIKLGGKFIFCDNEQEFLNNIVILFENRGWEQLLCADERMLRLFINNKLDIVTAADASYEAADACITGCEMLIARTGSIMLSAAQHLGRMAPVYFSVHIVFAYVNQVVPDIEDSFNALRKKYGTDLPSMINLATGPSRTADIEKTLVVGVHGPGEVFCFFINAEL